MDFDLALQRALHDFRPDGEFFEVFLALRRLRTELLALLALLGKMRMDGLRRLRARRLILLQNALLLDVELLQIQHDAVQVLFEFLQQARLQLLRQLRLDRDRHLQRNGIHDVSSYTYLYKRQCH